MHLYNPPLQSLGVEPAHRAPGEAGFHPPIDARHLNRRGMLHGALLATAQGTFKQGGHRHAA
ncbi:hypothetical protein D3C85_1623040 [compost metagenome]